MSDTEIWLNSAMWWGTLGTGIVMGMALSWFFKRMLRWADRVSGISEPAPGMPPYTMPTHRAPWLRSSSIFGSVEIADASKWPWPPSGAERETDETRT